MAEQTKPTAPVAETKEQLLSKLSKLELYFKQYAGRPNHNPYHVLRVIDDLTHLVSKGATPELAAKVNAIKEEAPIVNPKLIVVDVAKDLSGIAAPLAAPKK